MATKQVGRPEKPIARRRFVSVSVAAEYLSVSDRTIRYMVAQGRLQGFRNGRILRVDMNDVESCLKPMPGGGNAA